MKRAAILGIMLPVLAAGAFVMMTGCGGDPKVPVIRVGHVGHDHHSALYVACLNGELFRKDYDICLECLKERKILMVKY